MSVHRADDPEEPLARRIFLSYLAAALTSLVGIVAGVPILGYLVQPLRGREQARWITLGRAGDFAGREPQPVTFTITRQDGWVEVREARSCWVVPEDGGRFTVFNGRCPHLGCAYSWQTQGAHTGKFYCPCHDGVYDRNGTVLDGPPPRPLDSLETATENGDLRVLYRDFNPGVTNKTPL
jgi:menaquinol-cytochrome c reductase iron-sulfur subunit